MILTVSANPAIDRVYFVERFQMGAVYRPLKMTCTAGGKGLNVARVARILGAEVTAMGFAGGYNGEFIKAEVEKLGIADRFTPIAGETRICINIADSSGRSGEILEPGPAIEAAEAAQFLEEFQKTLSRCDVICASGSLPKGLDSGFYCELVRLARASGRKMIVDTSGSALEDVIKAKPYMVKPNRDELAKLLGSEIVSLSDVPDALRALHAQGITIPLVTLGSGGAMAYIDGQFYHYTTPDIPVKNTVGSGDSTIAGIAVGLQRGLTVRDAVRLGMAAGTANTQFDQTGMVSPELVEFYYKQIDVKEI